MNGSEILGIIGIIALSMVSIVALALGLIPRFLLSATRLFFGAEKPPEEPLGGVLKD